MRTHSRLRWIGLGRILLVAIAAAVAVVLLLPATASSKRARTADGCFSPPPRPDGPVFPKQGPPGTVVMFHGSKMSHIGDVKFKAKGGWIDAFKWWYSGGGWETTIVPAGAVTGPIVIYSDESFCTPVMLQKFTVAPS